MNDFELHAVGTTAKLTVLEAAVARSAARIADIELGLKRGRGQLHWRNRAKQRLATLGQERVEYGLLPHEEEEMARLKDLLG